jgi:hypothetical protein
MRERKIWILDKHPRSATLAKMAGYLGLTLGRDAVLPAELLPELEPDLVAALPQLEHDHLARHSFGAKIKLVY